MIADSLLLALALLLRPGPQRRRRSKRKGQEEAREFLSRRKLHERFRPGPGRGLDAAVEPNELIKAKPAGLSR
jgi:hypothetical protein